MYERITRKNFLSMEEMRAGHKQWLLDYGWSLDYIWHRKPHAACKESAAAEWALQGYGFYEGADGRHRLYQSHRCTKCKMMVQHNQLCTYDGVPEGAITRLVVMP